MPEFSTADLLARAEALQAMPSDHFDFTRAADLLRDITKGLTARLQEEAAKNAGNVSAVRVIKSMLNTKEMQTRPGLQYAWTDEKDKQCICDGYRAFRLVKPLPLPERPENAGDHIDLNKIFPADISDYYAVDLPTAAELRAYIQKRTAEKKAAGESLRGGILWSFGTAAPTVNAKYLLDLLTVLPDVKTIRYKNTVSVMYVQGSAGEAVLLPVRVFDERQAEEEAQKRMKKALQAGDAIAFDDFAASLLTVRPA